MFETQKIRKLIGGAVLDLTYFHTDRGRLAIHQALSSALSQMPEDALLIIIGHSLGCLISSYYITDMHLLKTSDSPPDNQRANRLGIDTQKVKALSPIARLDTLVAFITLGNNMTLFASTRDPAEMPWITVQKGGMPPPLPGSAVAPSLASEARWLNFYSRNDYLGFPLRHSSCAYADEERLKDIEVRSEGRWRSIILPGPLNCLAAHSGYWKDRQVNWEIATFIRRALSIEN